MSDDDKAAIDAAVDWLQRSRDPNFCDWDDLVAWMDNDPEAARAYNRLAAREEALIDALAEAAGRAAPRWRTWARRTRGISLQPAVSQGERASAGRPLRRALAALAMLSLLSVPLFGTKSYETVAGETVSVSLPNGIVAHLNGGTRLRHARYFGNDVTLEAGEAFFVVRHDPAREFTVFAGPLQIDDIGTRFNVSLFRSEAEVSVASGHVSVETAGHRVRVPAGQAFVIDGARRARIMPIAPGAVDGWRRGRLSYVRAPCARIASDLGRIYGRDIRCRGSAERRYSGSFSVKGEFEARLGAIGELFGLEISRDGTIWWLER